jgi:uncharacterized protein (TIGR02145 family)
MMKVIRDEEGLWLAVKLPDGEINGMAMALKVNPPVSAPPPVETGTFTDERDGQTYKTVKMPDGKVWMAQNLNYKPESGNSWCYDDDEAMGAKYGRLYDWETAKAACPKGWRLPTREEWGALVEACGGKDAAGKKLKTASGWNGNGNGTDDYGFSALPGGYRNYSDGSFDNAGDYGIWWTATENGGSGAYNRYMSYDYDDVDEYYYYKSYGRSVRCLED